MVWFNDEIPTILITSIRRNSFDVASPARWLHATNARAISLQSHALFDPEVVTAFQADVTLDGCFSEVDCPVDVATFIFVLSAIHPDKFSKYVEYYNESF